MKYNFINFVRFFSLGRLLMMMMIVALQQSADSAEVNKYIRSKYNR